MANGWLDLRKYGEHSRQHLGHTYRYKLASGFVTPSDTVLDAASGTGYGAAILAERAKRVYAVEIDTEAIKLALDRHSIPKISYARADLTKIERFPSVDVAVSFETIEHLDAPPQRFANLLKRAAKRLIILSAPVIPTVGVNPHHVHDFTEDSLRDLIVDHEEWFLWEQVRQGGNGGPYLIVVAYRKAL